MLSPSFAVAYYVMIKYRAKCRFVAYHMYEKRLTRIHIHAHPAFSFVKFDNCLKTGAQKQTNKSPAHGYGQKTAQAARAPKNPLCPKRTTFTRHNARHFGALACARGSSVRAVSKQKSAQTMLPIVVLRYALDVKREKRERMLTCCQGGGRWEVRGGGGGHGCRGGRCCHRRPPVHRHRGRAGGGHTVRDAARIVVLRPCVILQRAGKNTPTIGTNY